MRGIHILLLALGLLLLLAARAHAGEVDDGSAALTSLEADRGRATTDLQALARAYQQRTDAVSALKAQPASWGRDRKLGALLAEAKEMAAALDRTDAALHALEQRIAAARRALMAAIDRELQGEPPPERREALTRLRGELVAKLGAARRLRLPDDRIDPADDAEDLELKAASLETAEKELAGTEEVLGKRAAYYHRLARLARAKSRADEQDLFHDEASRRPVNANGRSGFGDAAPAETTPGPQPPSTAIGGELGVVSDPSVLLSEVVDSATLDQLRRAERSGDPESRARAAELAGKDLGARQARLAQRRQEMKRRAQELRGERP